MKTMGVTVRARRPVLRRYPKEAAGLNHNGLNGAASTTSEKARAARAEGKPVTCAEAAAILRLANRMLTPKDRSQIAAGIEEARRRMSHEHLH